MQFRTEIFTKKFDTDISYTDKSFFIGSCFTDNISNKLKEVKFDVISNPFGVLYNPISVKQSLDFIIDNKKFNETYLEFYNEKWFSFFHHSKFSLANKKETLELINNNITKTHDFLKQTKFLFITFGTSWAYKLKSTNSYVANCHKLPSKIFEHTFLSKEQIVDEYNLLINRLLSINPNMKIIFTVSPIRHWKNGATNNQLSKSNLIIAINDIVNQFDCANYFPAYEIMIDDLRDYRFYADDMIHPNQQAIDYIWDKFKSSYIKKSTLQISNKIKKFIVAKNHIPFNSDSDAHKIFLKTNLDSIKKFLEKYPYINLQEELKYFTK